MNNYLKTQTNSEFCPKTVMLPMLSAHLHQGD